MSAIKSCKNCGKQFVDSTFKFCPYCGVELNEMHEGQFTNSSYDFDMDNDISSMIENLGKSEFEIRDNVLIRYFSNNVVIPYGVTEIGEYAFNNCNSLKNITIPKSVTTIDDFAFFLCDGLKSITIPKSVTFIGYGVFSACRGLESITVERGNRNYYSINNCLLEISSKTLIGGCKNSIIPTDGSVTTIDSYAFRGCRELKSITIPKSVISIGYSAFSDCSDLESITVERGNKNYYSINNCLLEISSKTLILGCKNSIIPADGSVITINHEAFYGCDGLEAITIPNSVTIIGDWAFSGCYGLESITIPKNVTSIGVHAFACCDNLKIIFCEAESEPQNWDKNWLGDCQAKVVWGYKGK